MRAYYPLSYLVPHPSPCNWGLVKLRMNLPANANNTANMVICERIPCSHGQVEVVLVATLAGILNSDSNNIAFPANTVIGSWAGVS